MELLFQHLLAALIFGVLGLLLLTAWFWLLVRFAPFSVVREIEQDQNTALAIIIAAVIIGFSLIIAAAIWPSP